MLYLSLLAVTCLVATPVTAQAPSWCTNGIPNLDEGVCCALECKTCGGHGCGNHPGGSANCCGGDIAKAGKVCSATQGPPCMKGPPSGNGTCTLSVGVQYLGSNTDVHPPVPSTSPAECCSSCGKTKDCVFFTFDSTTSLCSLKNGNAPDTSRMNSNCTSGYLGAAPDGPPTPPATVHVSVAVTGPALSTTSGHFVSWNIDASANRGFFWRNIDPRLPYGKQLASQAAALSTSNSDGFSILRFGGSGNDYLTYEFGGTPCPPVGDTTQCMNQTQWVALLEFTKASQAKMVFGLSMNTGHDLTSATPEASDPGFPWPWDPSNARAILQWTIANGYDDLLFGLELGNEQNGKYTGAKIATNFGILHNLTLELWPDASKRPVLVGPDPHSYHGQDPKVAWIGDFLDAAAADGTPIFAATHHEYTEIDSTTFTSPKVLDVSTTIAAMVNNTVRTHSKTAQVWGGEIGPHNGGSPVCDHTSMRWANFGDSFWYADSLGTKAAHGYSTHCRQDYIGADYGLVDCSTGAPLPDLYTGMLFARLMGKTVLAAAVTTPGSSAIRAYAHCGPGGKGSVTVLLMNLHPTAVGNVTLPPQFNNNAAQRSRFTLQPSAEPSKILNVAGLLGTGSVLNGVLLEVGADGSLPAMAGVKEPSSAVIELPPHSITFVVYEGNVAEACA